MSTEKTDWLVENLIARSSVNLIASEESFERQALFMHLGKNMVANDLAVIYVDVGSKYEEATKVKKLAERTGIILHMAAAERSRWSIAESIETLQNWMPDNEAGDLSNHVFIIDPLHKIVTGQKLKDIRAATKALRTLADRKATVICGADAIYEPGEDSVRRVDSTTSNIDNIIYLIKELKNDGSVVITSEPDKGCSDCGKVAFEIGKDNSVAQIKIT